MCHFKCQTKDVNVNSFVKACFGLGECDMEQTTAACEVCQRRDDTSPLVPSAEAKKYCRCFSPQQHDRLLLNKLHWQLHTLVARYVKR